MRTARLKFLFLILILSGIWIVSRYLRIDPDNAKAFLERFPVWLAVLVYALVYVIGTILIPITKDIFKIIGAVCLGAVLSSLGIWIAEVINAILLFYLARYLGREFVQERLRGRAKAIDESVDSWGFKGFLVLRLVPLIPYRFLDLLAGLTSISFIKYLIIVVIGSPLRIFWIQYILAGVGVAVFKNPSALIDYMRANKVAFFWSFIYLILVIIVVFRFKFKRKKRI